MGYINIGDAGIELIEIIKKLGNKDYKMISCRCEYEDPQFGLTEFLTGYCQYEKGKLLSLDGDIYSLKDKYIKWQEYENEHYDLCLDVIAKGEFAPFETHH